MFKSPFVASFLSLSLLFGVSAAQACPLGLWGPADPSASPCGASLLEKTVTQSAGPTSATISPSREMFMRISTEPNRERLAIQFSFRPSGADRSFDGLAPANAGQAFMFPDAWRFDYLEPSVRSSLAWRQEAEQISRQESIADLSTQSAAAAALAHLPGQFGAAGAFEALKRQDVERWRQMGAWTMKSGWELDTAPTKDTMFYMKGFYSPASQKTLAEAKFGIAVFDTSFWGAPQGKIYAGPFAVADGLRRDQISKIGAHVTLSEIGAFHITFASGLSQDRLKGRGVFGLIETSWKF